MNITYTKYGDYLLPNLTIAKKENKQLNKYGLLRLEYLKNNKKVLYQELLKKDKLNEHLFSVWIYVNAPIPPLESQQQFNQFIVKAFLNCSCRISNDLHIW